MYCAGTNWRPAAAGRPASRGGAGTTRLSPHELPPLRQFISSNATQIIINQDVLQLKLSWINLRRILCFNNDFKSYLPFPHDLSQPLIFSSCFLRWTYFAGLPAALSAAWRHTPASAHLPPGHQVNIYLRSTCYVSGSGSAFTKFCGSGSAYDQCGSTSLVKSN